MIRRQYVQFKRTWLAAVILSSTFTRITSSMAQQSYSTNNRKSIAESRRESRHKYEQDREDARLAAKNITVKPLTCVLSYESALLSATSLETLIPYFSTHYTQVYMPKQSNERQQELSRLKSAYVYPLPGATERKVCQNHINNGIASVSLKGSTSYKGGTKGTIVDFRLIPEGNYWRIDGYSATKGLELINIFNPKPPI